MRKSAKKSLVKALILGAGLVFAGNAYSQEQTKEPQTIATFEYQSNRPEPEYNGKTFVYNILEDGSIVQADKPSVKFSPIWFYDVNNNGKIDEAEIEFMKSGKLIYMSSEFNEKANRETKKVLESLIKPSIIKPSISEVTNPSNSLANSTPELVYEGTLLSSQPLENQNTTSDLEELAVERKDIDKDVVESEKNLITETKKIKTGLSIILQPISDFEFEKKGASIGMRYDIGLFGIGVLGNMSFSPDEVVETYMGETSTRTGRHAEGETIETQKFSLGAGLETRLGFFIAGAGINYNSAIRQSDERIMKGTETLTSNTSSFSYNNFSLNGYAGTELKISDWLKLGAIVGYDEESGVFGGLRGTFTIPLPDISYEDKKNIPDSKPKEEGN